MYHISSEHPVQTRKTGKTLILRGSRIAFADLCSISRGKGDCLLNKVEYYKKFRTRFSTSYIFNNTLRLFVGFLRTANISHILNELCRFINHFTPLCHCFGNFSKLSPTFSKPFNEKYAFNKGNQCKIGKNSKSKINHFKVEFYFVHRNVLSQRTFKTEANH